MRKFLDRMEQFNVRVVFPMESFGFPFASTSGRLDVGGSHFLLDNLAIGISW